MEALLAAVAGYSLVCAVFAAGLASAKGRDSVAWFFAGLIFGIIGMLAAGLIETQESEDAMRRRRKAAKDER